MKTYIYESKRFTLMVVANEEGYLYITHNGQPYENADAMIANYGGVENFLKKCTEVEGEAGAEAYMADKIAAAKAKAEESNARREAEKNALKNAYDALVAMGTIPATVDNIRTVMLYLNTMNWGMWELPALEIGYTANQYQCGGMTVTTISLDRPVKGISKFKTPSPVGHLNCYTNICRF